jgi:hypothetical protein
MANDGTHKLWQPTPTTLVAGGMVLGGFLLTAVSWWFLLLTGLGTFGPGILRELGWLRDKDEFQREATHRAGYHAFLIAGLVAFGLEAFFRTGGSIEHPHRLTSFFLALVWFTWFFSSLLAYWGAQKTAGRTLIVFGVVWLLFTIVSNLGPEWSGWAALLLHPLLALPFFALAWLSRRWPRVTGIILLGLSLCFFQFFGWSDKGLEGVVSDIFILFIGPLLASGLALLGVRKETEEQEELEFPVTNGTPSSKQATD